MIVWGILFAFHVALPLLLLASLALRKHGGRLEALLHLWMVGSVVGWITLGGAGWPFVGFYIRPILWSCTIGVGTRALYRLRHLPWISTWRSSALTASYLLPAIFFSFAIQQMVGGRAFDGIPVDLKPPLRNGRFLVGHGGSNIMLNHHQPAHAQSFALDIVKLNAFGFRSKGAPWRTALSEYEVFGEPVYSPCDGEVIEEEHALHDMIPPHADPDHLLGNHVIVACEGVSVLLAHLQHNSTLVRKGDHVSSSSRIGLVGNTGNTSEPHLHIHAVRGQVTDPEMIAKRGEPVPIRFNERFLVRNDTF